MSCISESQNKIKTELTIEFGTLEISGDVDKVCFGGICVKGVASGLWRE